MLGNYLRQTPKEAGVEMQPVDLVVAWARLNHNLERLGSPPQTYEEFITSTPEEEATKGTTR